MKTLLSFGLLIVQCTWLCAQNPVPPSELVAASITKSQINLTWHYTEPNGLRIVVLGSSTAAGLYVPKGCMFMLADSLALAVPGSVVTNLAVGGYFSDRLLPTGTDPDVDPERNITKALSLNPHIVIVSLPSNDAAFSIPVSTSMKNFRAIRAAAAAQNVKVFFTTTQPRNFPDAPLRELLRIGTDSIRAQFGSYVIDVYDELTDVANNRFIKAKYMNSNNDGVHVNTTGHQYIFQKTLDAISPHLTNFEIHRSVAQDGPYELLRKIPSRILKDKNLESQTAYYYKMRTVSAQGQSAFTAPVQATTRNPDLYYSKAAGNLHDLSTWGKELSGAGAPPPSFTDIGQYFVLRNRTDVSIDVPWTISGISTGLVVPPGVTLTVNQSFPGRVEAQEQSRVVLNHPDVPPFSKLHATSTVEYSALATTIRQAAYGDLTLQGNGLKTFSNGTTSIAGNLSIAAGTTVQGALSNASTIAVRGDVSWNGNAALVSDTRKIAMQFNKGAAQSVTLGSDVGWHALSLSSGTVLQVAQPTPVIIRAGSASGGGLMLADNTVFRPGSNTLQVEGAGTINKTNSTGRIAVQDGNISISSSAADINHLYFDNTQNTLRNWTQNVINGAVSIHTPMNVRGGLKIFNGTLHANGNITLLSNAVQSAAIARIEGNGRIDGNVIVQRFIPAIGPAYRYISTPVRNTNVQDWQASFPITGPFAGASAGTTASSMFYYDEPAGGWIGYPRVDQSSMSPIESGRGYCVYMFNGSSDITMTVTGNPFQGDLGFTLAGGTPTGNDGWNLLGNPYASAIAWSAAGWTSGSDAVSTTVSVRDNTLGLFRIYDHETGLGTLMNGMIASGQSFWVKAMKADATLAITEAAKTDAGHTVLLRTKPEPPQHLEITLRKDTVEDKAYVTFRADGINTFHARHDALKRSNSIFNVSTLSDDHVSLSLNSLDDSFCQKSVRINISNIKPGPYKLGIGKQETIRNLDNIVLWDKFTNTRTPVVQGDPYPFDVTPDTASYANRFVLVLKGSVPAPPEITMRHDTLFVPLAEGETIQWLRDGVPLAGATEAYLPAAMAGLYSATISNGRCNSAVSVPMTVLSTIDGTDDAEFSVFPNPVTRGTLILKVPPRYGQDFHIQISDALGKSYEPHTMPVKVENHTLSLTPELRPGVYTVTISHAKYPPLLRRFVWASGR